MKKAIKIEDLQHISMLLTAVKYLYSRIFSELKPNGLQGTMDKSTGETLNTIRKVPIANAMYLFFPRQDILFFNAHKCKH